MLIRKLAAEVSEQYIVIHCANAQSTNLTNPLLVKSLTPFAGIEDVKSLASTFQPVVLVDMAIPRNILPS